MTKSLALALALGVTLVGCGQARPNAPLQPRTAQVAAQAAIIDWAAVRREIKDAIEDGGADTFYTVQSVKAKATEKRGVYAFVVDAIRVKDGDKDEVRITGTWDSKAQEIVDSEEEEL